MELLIDVPNCPVWGEFTAMGVGPRNSIPFLLRWWRKRWPTNVSRQIPRLPPPARTDRLPDRPGTPDRFPLNPVLDGPDHGPHAQMPPALVAETEPDRR